MRFLLDECLPPQMAELLRATGHDCAHVYELGLGGQPDERIMAHPASSPAQLRAVDPHTSYLWIDVQINVPSAR